MTPRFDARWRASSTDSGSWAPPPAQAERAFGRGAGRGLGLLALRLPDMAGLDVLKKIRETHAGTEVILLTGHGSIDTAIESIRAGAFDYVAKPWPLDELEVRIERALERQSLRRRASLLERGLTPADPGDMLV